MNSAKKSVMGPYYMPEDSIGVLGVPVPGRTQADMRLQAEFDRAKENFVNLSAFGPRTRADLAMQQEFNPLVKEGYCGAGSCNMGVVSTNDNPYFHAPDPRIARTSDDPYNPYSKLATYLPLR